jgi:CheY-like chemotaxis protein
MTRVSDPRESDLGPSQQPSNGKTILLAEDDPFITRMYQTKLTTGGFNVVVANNGRDAYEQIKATNPDLVMLDINMPEMTGFQVIQALKADNVDITHVIVLTNSADPGDREQATHLGLEYLVKAELTPQEVLQHITKKLGLAAG